MPMENDDLCRAVNVSSEIDKDLSEWRSELLLRNNGLLKSMCDHGSVISALVFSDRAGYLCQSNA